MKRGILIAILVIVVFVIFLVLLGGFIYLQFQQEPFIPENSLLKIELAGKIIDSDDSVLSGAITIRDLFYHINRAKIDHRIKGIFLKLSYIQSGFSKIEDIGRILSDFKKSGKMVYAYIESGGLREYYLATFADKIYVFKGWDMYLKGLASESIFLKNTLSKLGVQAEMLQIGDYKTASNMFTQNEMTPAHRESLCKLLDDIYNSVLESIAAKRDIKLKKLSKLLDESPLTNQEYLKAGLIDKIVYEDEIFKNKKPKHRTVNFKTYKQTSSPNPYKGRGKLAVIFASGEIHIGKSGDKSLFGGKILGSDTVANQLRAVRKSPSIKAVVLRIDSPGGSPLASDIIRREVELTAEKKPVVISMSDLAASGGYWIAASGTKIMALPQTITGSIGVVGGKFVLKELYDNIGLNKEILKTSKYADMFSDYKLFTPGEREKLMKLMIRTYQLFLKIVSQNRNMKIKDVDKIAQGRVWAGWTAKKLNLIDKFGGIIEAINEAKELAKIPAEKGIRLKIFPKKKSLLDIIFEYIGIKATTINPIASIQAKLNSYKTFFPAVLMPYSIHIY